MVGTTDYTFAANMKKLGKESVSLAVPFLFISDTGNIYTSFMFHLLSLLEFKMLKGAKGLLKIATAKSMMREWTVSFFYSEGKHRDTLAGSLQV